MECQTQEECRQALRQHELLAEKQILESVAYIDYSKAFDTVCHSKLAAKLAATGITGNLLKWLKKFPEL